MDSDSRRRQRRSTYRLLIFIALAIAAGRIATVISRDGDAAFLSANDRSRWCTIAALVEARTYEIDQLINLKNKKGRQPWATIDMVRHRGKDGQLRYYSSKPPLFPTLVAGVYWLVYQASGLTLSAYPIYATRIVLACVNLPLLALFYFCTIGTHRSYRQRAVVQDICCGRNLFWHDVAAVFRFAEQPSGCRGGDSFGAVHLRQGERAKGRIGSRPRASFCVALVGRWNGRRFRRGK